MTEFNIITIIPARGGSKGILNKNIIDIAGKPLIGWSIEQSINSKLINHTFVSTNDNQIATVAKSYGAEIIWRPNELSGDRSSSESAILHALNYLKNERKIVPDYVVFMQATSPLRKSDDIKNAIQQILKEGGDSLFSGSKFEDFLFWEKGNDGLKSINYDYLNRGRRQDRIPQYVENGSLYISKTKTLLEEKNRLGGKISLYEMDFWQTWEIDTIEDVEIIEYYIEQKLKKNSILSIENLDLIVYDFDGVMTNNKALVDQNGKESVFVSRSDGLAISGIKKMNIPQIIISTEKNEVVQKRAEKLNIPCIQGVTNKKDILLDYTQKNQLDLSKVIFIGNDINDLDAMKIVGYPVAPADSFFMIKKIAALILRSNGGEGVIREIYELLINNSNEDYN